MVLENVAQRLILGHWRQHEKEIQEELGSKKKMFPSQERRTKGKEIGQKMLTKWWGREAWVWVGLGKTQWLVHLLGLKMNYQLLLMQRCMLACQDLLDSGGRRVLPDLHLVRLHFISPSHPPGHSPNSLTLHMVLLPFVTLKNCFGLQKSS